MIAKISTGRGARGVLDYLLNEKRQEREMGQGEEQDRAPGREQAEAAEHTHETGRGEAELKFEERASGRAGEREEDVEHRADEKTRSQVKYERGNGIADDGPAYQEGSRARIIGGNMSGQDARELAREFGDFRALRPDVKNAVHHASLSAAKGERLTVEQWQQVAGEYVKGMGYERSAYVLIQHRDEPHDHVHIVTSNITVDGEVVPQYRNYQQAERIMRQVEREHGLESVRMSREVEQRAPTRGELEELGRSGKRSTKMLMQDTLDRALRDEPGTAEFIARLERAGISVNANIQSTGRVSGISFEHDGKVMKGSNLGRGYSWQGLQKRGLEYDEGRDLQALQEAKAKYLERQLEQPMRVEPGESFSEVFTKRVEVERELRETRQALANVSETERAPEEHEAEQARHSLEGTPARKMEAATEREQEAPWRSVEDDLYPVMPERNPVAELFQAANMERAPLLGAEGNGRELWQSLNERDETISGREALARAAGYDLTKSAEELLREATAPAYERTDEREQQQQAIGEAPDGRGVHDREPEINRDEQERGRGAELAREQEIETTKEIAQEIEQEIEREISIGWELSL